MLCARGSSPIRLGFWFRWDCCHYVECRRMFFFFSSRRRHTRFDCDWSSDVCSSDLLTGSPFPAGRGTFSLAGAGGFLFATNNLDGTISSYSMDSVSGTLIQVAGSPFPGVVASGDTLYSKGRLFVPDASSDSIAGFAPNLGTGTVSSLMGSPFQAGVGP